MVAKLRQVVRVAGEEQLNAAMSQCRHAQPDARLTYLQATLNEVASETVNSVTAYLRERLSSSLSAMTNAMKSTLYALAARQQRFTEEHTSELMAHGRVHHCLVDFKRVRILKHRLQNAFGGSQSNDRQGPDDQAVDEDLIDTAAVWQFGECASLIARVEASFEPSEDSDKEVGDNTKKTYLRTSFRPKDLTDMSQVLHEQYPHANHGRPRTVGAIASMLSTMRKLFGGTPHDFHVAKVLMNDPTNEYVPYRFSGEDFSSMGTEAGWSNREVRFVLLWLRNSGPRQPPNFATLADAALEEVSALLHKERVSLSPDAENDVKTGAQVRELLALLRQQWGASSQGFWAAERAYNNAALVVESRGGSAREKAICAALAFIEREAALPDRFREWGSDLVVTLHFFASVATGPVQEVCKSYARRAATRWIRENDSVPLDAGSEDILFLVEGLHGVVGAGLGDLPAVKKLRKQIMARVHEWPSTAYLGINTQPLRANQNPRVPRRGDLVLYELLSNAMIWAFFFQQAGVPLPGEVSLRDVCAVTQASKPYRQESDLPDVSDFKDQCYMVTHWVYVMTRWCQERLPKGGWEEELSFLESQLPRIIAMRDVDLVGEFVQALKCFGLSETASPVADGLDFLLNTQDRLSGSWGGCHATFDHQYHATICAIGGLIEHTYGDES